MDLAEKLMQDFTMPCRKAISNASALGDSEIQRFYGGRVVFVTGGSGFIGKQLIEKLLRNCKISKVFVLLRPKKGKTCEERLEDLLRDPVYDLVREQQPDYFRKIVPVKGDVSDIKLGINDNDWKCLTREVNIIFHVAATTKFDEELSVATKINVRGTRECLTLGKSCTNLCSFVHVSTAYTHTTYKNVGEEIEEKFYKSPLPPDTLISIAEQIDVKRLSNITPNLIKNWPNTYTFTKAVAEELIRTTTDDLPICIVRPGIVVPPISEPAPGWVDFGTVYSVTGILVGVIKGVMHTMAVNVDLPLGFIPCDYVNNAIIAAGKETATSQAKGGNNTKIYSINCTAKNPVTFGQVKETLSKDYYGIATPVTVGYCYLIPTANKIAFQILTLLLHLIPALLADLVCFVLRKERRFFRLAKKMYTLCLVVSYFGLYSWLISDHNTTALYQNLSKEDKIIFNFNVSDVDWKEYCLIWVLGIRKYFLKDGLKDTDYAVKKQKILRVIHYVIMPLYAYGLWKASIFVYFALSTICVTIIRVFC